MGIVKLINKIRLNLKILWTRVRWFFLKDYYDRLAVQAKFLYRQSELFKTRYRELGLDYADGCFTDEGTGMHFFEKAKREPLGIRWQILMDCFFKRPMIAYYLPDNDFD